jgi:NAD-dependent SIR2 family protein deacetylase
MNGVFIIGTGFSKEICNSIPLLKDLSVKVKEKLYSTGEFSSPLIDSDDDIESWLTYLSQSQPWLKEYHNLQNRALFLRLTEIIGQVLTQATQDAVKTPCVPWLKTLIKHWADYKSNVITLNYDTLIERAAKELNIETQNIYPVSLTDIRRASSYVQANGKTSFTLYKLHGSVNWYYSGATEYQGEVLYFSPVSKWSDQIGKIEKDALSASDDKVPLIIPPTSEKVTYFQHESLRQIWQKASAALQSADIVYCIGYSLPITDLGIRFFLLNNSKPQIKIPFFIINKDDSVSERYHHLLGNAYDINTTHANKGIPKFVEDLTGQ